MSEVAQGELVTVTEHQSSPIAGETKAQKGKKLAVMRTQTPWLLTQVLPKTSTDIWTLQKCSYLAQWGPIIQKVLICVSRVQKDKWQLG